MWVEQVCHNAMTRDEKPLTLKPVKASKGKTKKTAGLACVIHYTAKKSTENL